MNIAHSDHQRLARLVELVTKEDRHLLAVRSRLLGDDCAVDTARLETLVADDIGIDRLESFGAKFGRMQDTIVDKLVPAILNAVGEHTGAAIDNLARMERLELVNDTDEWLEMRRLRNRLVHEYIDRPDDLAPALERACEFTDRMHADFLAMREYIADHFGISPEA